jgi:hypothetical protein
MFNSSFADYQTSNIEHFMCYKGLNSLRHYSTSIYDGFLSLSLIFTKTYGVVKVKLHTLLMSAVDQGE